MPDDWPDGYGRVVLAEVDSTLDEARRRYSTLQEGPIWLLALNQTKARGRRGRPWAHPRGNFAATLILPLAERADTIALRSFVTALAVHDAFVTLTGRTDPFSLKWPNDVLLNGSKVAGILLESLAPNAGMPGLAIGIGVNLAEAPAPQDVEPQALRPVALAQETGALVRPEEFLNVLAVHYATHEATMRSLGFGPIRDAWLARASHLGQTITARVGTETLTGVFETLDERGHLVLTCEGRRHAIPAADVFF
ncbi:biotin--[acetyl-CoA-carboxylase] ligase [Pseudooceanicola sediminis]|uniref:biotin--[biotin carboxyl-carrier protein] ligase n=1 Tax=Pseudooceanicola sediminis TaxID=2211117 RepID=A0A399J4B4_9RHOB|nr:biotin--[acetyl-CoA-carboxylase] ligase [Pseudooceanicola sediminis]KAA2316162.1 biotin--[acetyl-CoA-carboxylase] ligase [Puniceibacterium sp. HSS470]RII39269.1 biotin--[acetyl-CoA-carboxylase] ligase [Pseudooceanicola sediminis]|tara:strand:+ start:107388 stop:108143 length:756 start_codon:yes stop_codon:yes gene_type:complete